MRGLSGIEAVVHHVRTSRYGVGDILQAQDVVWAAMDWTSCSRKRLENAVGELGEMGMLESTGETRTDRFGNTFSAGRWRYTGVLPDAVVASLDRKLAEADVRERQAGLF